MNYLSNLLPDGSDKWIALLSRCANYTSPCTSFQMSSSEGSCSPANTPDHVCPGPTFVGQTLHDTPDRDPYSPPDSQSSPDYTPASPDYTPATPVSPVNPYSFLDLVDESNAQYGYYPIELIPGSDPIKFIVRYPCPWDSDPRDFHGEWSMMLVECRFLDHIMWFEGEWHLVWGTYTTPVYRSLD